MASKLKNQLHTYPPGASETGCAYPYCPDPVANNIVLDDLNAVIAQTNLTNEIQQLVAVGLPTQSALTAEYYHIVCDEEYVDPSQLSGMVADFCLCYEDPERAASNRIDCEILSDVYWYHPDYVGSNELITDITGEPYQYFFYTPFGETILQEDAFSASYDNPWRFNGKELDAETGNYYYGARYYNPKWSVWLGVDRLAGKYPNNSPYVYTANNPISLIDPNGDSTIYFVNYSMTSGQAQKVANYTQQIFERNGITGLSYKVISPEDAKELKLIETDAVISLTNEKGNEYSSEGNTDPYVVRSSQDYQSIEDTYVNLNSNTFTQRKEEDSRLYAISYVAAHEALHQFKMKASYFFFGGYNELEIHDNNEPNLNHDGDQSIPIGPSNYLRKEESLTRCDRNLLRSFFKKHGIQ